MTEDSKDIIQENELNLCIKENNIYIDIPKKILSKGMKILTDYIRIYTVTNSL